MFAVLAGLVVGTTAAQATNDPLCDNGLRFTEGATSAAMGLRVMGVEVTNCGTEPLQLNGYPQVTLLDAGGLPLDVAILEGTGGITVLDGFDDPPQPITVPPGESARSAFVWKNRQMSPEPPQVGRHVEMAAAPGGTWQPLVPADSQDSVYIDLGDTGRLGVRAWYR